jgi:hypothetical protein
MISLQVSLKTSEGIYSSSMSIGSLAVALIAMSIMNVARFNINVMGTTDVT